MSLVTNRAHNHFTCCISAYWQMKAVAGLKMSYQVQQAINGAKDTVIRGFRHEDSDSALCSHLYSMVRGNRQHRRAFLVSLLNLFDDSSVSSFLDLSCFSAALTVLHTALSWNTLRSLVLLIFKSVEKHKSVGFKKYIILFSYKDSSWTLYTLSLTENGGEHAAVHSRQLGLFPLPDPGGASFHHAPYRYYSVRLW